MLLLLTDSWWKTEFSIKRVVFLVQPFYFSGLCWRSWEEFAQGHHKHCSTSVLTIPCKTGCRGLWAKKCHFAASSLLTCRDECCLCYVSWVQLCYAVLWGAAWLFNRCWCAKLLEWHVDLLFSGWWSSQPCLYSLRSRTRRRRRPWKHLTTQWRF